MRRFVFAAAVLLSAAPVLARGGSHSSGHSSSASTFHFAKPTLDNFEPGHSYGHTTSKLGFKKEHTRTLPKSSFFPKRKPVAIPEHFISAPGHQTIWKVQ